MNSMDDPNHLSTFYAELKLVALCGSEPGFSQFWIFNRNAQKRSFGAISSVAMQFHFASPMQKKPEHHSSMEMPLAA